MLCPCRWRSAGAQEVQTQRCWWLFPFKCPTRFRKIDGLTLEDTQANREPDPYAYDASLHHRLLPWPAMRRHISPHPTPAPKIYNPSPDPGTNSGIDMGTGRRAPHRGFLARDQTWAPSDCGFLARDQEKSIPRVVSPLASNLYPTWKSFKAWYSPTVWETLPLVVGSQNVLRH